MQLKQNVSLIFDSINQKLLYVPKEELEKVLFVGKKENISAKKLKLRRCFDGIIYTLAILFLENNDERGEKLHYIPNNLNQKYWFCHGPIIG